MTLLYSNNDAAPQCFLETYPLYYFVNYDEQNEYSWYLDSLRDQISIAQV